MIIMLGLVEVSVAMLVGHQFLPARIAWALDAIGVLALLVVTWSVASVMWRRHEAGPQRVRLVLGFLGQIDIPRSAIASIEELPELTPQQSDRVGPTFEEDQLNLTAAVGLPRVAIHFIEPIVGRRLWQRRPVRSAVTTDPARLLSGR
jgi:hypothetical protein